LTLTLLLPSLTFAHVGHKTFDYIGWSVRVSNWLDMSYYCGSGLHNCCCGPSSGTSIGWYYKTRPLEYYDNNYDEYLPSPKSKMYDRLYDYMDTDIFGATDWHDYGPGFVEMALHYGCDNFSYVPDDEVTDGDFGNIVEAIENGWPVALIGSFKDVDAIEENGNGDWPPFLSHWIAIKGYSYRQNLWPPGQPIYERRIVCTDSYCGSNKLVISWDELIEDGSGLQAIIIKDVDTENDGYVENFEWGDDGDSLEDWQDKEGEVDWEVTARGSSVIEIDDDVETHPGSTGTKSARIYRDGSNSVYAYYSLLEPSNIGFYLMKSADAIADFRNGNGSKCIWVEVNDEEEVRYADSNGYYHTLPYTFPVNSWRHVEFKNIDWDSGTYDIYIHGYREAQGVPMVSGSYYQDNLYFGSYWDGSGAFWIDDISDSLIQED
jgi:hypothetical protein